MVPISSNRKTDGRLLTVKYLTFVVIAMLYIIRIILWLAETFLGSGAVAITWASFGQPELASHALVWFIAAISVHGIRTCGARENGP